MNRFASLYNTINKYARNTNHNVFWHIVRYLRIRKYKGFISPEEYCNFRLDSQPQSFVDSFLPHYVAHIKYWDKVLNPLDYACLARDKYLSHMLMEKGDISRPQLYCYFSREYGDSFGVQANDYEHVRKLFEANNVKEFICKPSFYSSHGEGVFICEELIYEDSDCVMVLKNKKVSLREFLKTCNPCLFESLIKQTSQFASFNPSSVNTVRMVTALYPNNEVKLVAAFLKIGRNGSEVDNAGTGGNVDCGVDVETGKIYNSLQFNSWMDTTCITHHPDTNTLLEGVVINNWQSHVERVKQFQKRISFIKMIGWDVAITDDGPVIIEINNYWDPTGQLFIQRGWEPDVRDCWLAWKDKLRFKKC